MNKLINEKFKKAEWSAKAKFDKKLFIIMCVASAILLTLSLLFFLNIIVVDVENRQTQTYLGVLLMFVILILVTIPFLKAQRYYAVDGKRILYTRGYYSANGSWFEADFSNIQSCRIQISKSKKSASFDFIFIKPESAGSMGMKKHFIFKNIENHKNLVSVLTKYGVRLS